MDPHQDVASRYSVSFLDLVVTNYC
jgi:hypothetical protein